MRIRDLSYCLAACVLAWQAAHAQAPQASGMPHLQRQGAATQLVVDGKPFLMIAGELHNSSASSLEYMKPIWPRLAAMHLNTVLAPVYWELLEPEEGKWDFALVDGLIQDARRNDQRLVFLWFGSWKNGMSSYVPVWVKANQDRFPRVQTKAGRGTEILSTFSPANRGADARAFGILMRHIKEVDGQAHTVLMMQVENEVGVLGDSRDRSEAADQAFAGQVPKELMDHLQKHHDTLFPDLAKLWAAAGSKTAGTWEQVFGAGASTDEIFMAWNYARYVNQVAAAGKAEYALPMYVNTWLSGPGRHPGDWPSGGPEPHVMEVWQAGAPQIDIFSPDIYAANFTDWCGWYHRAGNPLFIPETGGQSGGNPFYAFGRHEAMGYSPFAIDSLGMMPNAAARTEPAELPLAKAYAVLTQLQSLILEHQGKGEIFGVAMGPGDEPQKITAGNYNLEVSYQRGRGGAPPPPPAGAQLPAGQQADRAGAIIIATGPDEYFIGGTGPLVVTFSPNGAGAPVAGIAWVDEGSFVNGRWVPGRRLNGDENSQGQSVRMSFSAQTGGIEHVKLYRYR